MVNTSKYFSLVPISYCPPHFYTTHFINVSILVHDSRTAIMSPKPKLTAPKLPVVKDQDPGLGFLGWMGVVCLAGGGIVAVTCGVCCYIRTCGARASL